MHCGLPNDGWRAYRRRCGLHDSGNSATRLPRLPRGDDVGHTDTPTNEPDSRRIIDAFLDSGANFIGHRTSTPGGQSEEVVGRAIQVPAGRRRAATKGFHAHRRGPNDRGLRPQVPDPGPRRQPAPGSAPTYVDLSVPRARRLDADRGDHGPRCTASCQSGKVATRLLQLQGSQIVEAAWRPRRSTATPFISSSRRTRSSTADRGRRAPACERTPRHHDLQPTRRRGAHPAVQAGRGAAGRQPVQPPGPVRQPAHDANLDIADEVGKVAAEWVPPPRPSPSAWTLARRGVTACIIGPRTSTSTSRTWRASTSPRPSLVKPPGRRLRRPLIVSCRILALSGPGSDNIQDGLGQTEARASRPDTRRSTGRGDEGGPAR